MNLTEKIKAVAYCRVSSKEQEREGFSLEAQSDLLHKYARENNFHIMHDYIEVESAKEAGRPKFDEMVKFLDKESKSNRRNRCRIVLVEKNDRLYRNVDDAAALNYKRMDLEIHFVKENQILDKSLHSSQKFMQFMKLGMAINYIDNLSEETQKGIRAKAEQGLWPTVAPLGYLNTTDDRGRKIIVPDEIRAPIVRKIFEEYVTGNYTTRSMAKWAYQQGLRSKKGNRVSKSRMHDLLRSRIYTGNFDFKGQFFEGIHEPIISEELWEEVQDILSGRNAISPSKVKHQHAFSRFIKCGHCGCSLVAQKQKGHVYYACSGSKGKCGEPYVREEVLSDQFGEYLKQLVFDEEFIEWTVQALKEGHTDEKKEREQAIKRLRIEYDRLEKRIDTAYNDRLDGRISVEDYDRRHRGWLREQDEIQSTIAGFESARRNYLDDGIRLLELAHGAYDLFKKQEPKEQRKLLNFVFLNRTYANGKLTAEYKQPFDMIAKTIPQIEVIEGGKMTEEAKSEKWGG